MAASAAQPRRGLSCQPLRISCRNHLPVFRRGARTFVAFVGEEGVRDLPRYVAACRSDEWSLEVVSKKTGEVLRVPFRCGSWRCARCAKGRAFEDSSRIVAAMKAHGGPFAVLTLTVHPRKWLLSGLGKRAAYRALVWMWTLLRKRWVREFGPFVYAATVEAQRNGWPHLNLIVDGWAARTVAAAPVKGPNGGYRTVRRALRPMMKATGWGVMRWVSWRPATQWFAWYMAKYMAKSDQRPMEAPKRFRRLRSSRGFLPPPEASEEWTGRLVMAPVPSGETACR